MSDQDVSRFVKMKSALQTIADKEIDSGYGAGAIDFWVTVDGIEYYVTIQRSELQKAKQAYIPTTVQ